MSHKNKPSIVRQVTVQLDSCLAIGRNKHQDKKTGADRGRIYSWGTYHTYLRLCIAFARWAHSEYGCRDIRDARRHVPEYIRFKLSQGVSTYTAKATISALAKLYQCKGSSFGVNTSPRRRDSITRSRYPAVRDSGFSLTKNRDLVIFCHCSGLRRAELKALTGDKLRVQPDGTYAILVSAGAKGGRRRLAPLVGPEDDIRRVVELMTLAGHGKVFASVHSHADIHHMRAVYAARVYALYAKPLSEICGDFFWNKDKYVGRGKPRGGFESRVYYCRKDKQGIWYDKVAMQQASLALGHSRISIVGQHYLYGI